MTLNQELFLFINSFALQNNILDTIAISCAEYMPYVFIVIEVYIFFILKLKDEAIFAFYSMLMGLTLSKIISLFYIHNRPFVDNIGVALVEHAPDSSFPSDHTTFMLSIAISLIFFTKTKKIGLFLLFIGFISGLTRVFEGIHYPFDIFGALVISFIGAFLIYKVKSKLQKVNNLIIKITIKD
ncbi:MAG: undecaprenyl-diphosphatase [Epsilonproteobacteria bacterium]|nr:MAG: undecaprenyl-diphosphatase [Campylobacterota bacterium]